MMTLQILLEFLIALLILVGATILIFPILLAVTYVLFSLVDRLIKKWRGKDVE